MKKNRLIITFLILFGTSFSQTRSDFQYKLMVLPEYGEYYNCQNIGQLDSLINRIRISHISAYGLKDIDVIKIKCRNALTLAQYAILRKMTDKESQEYFSSTKQDSLLIWKLKEYYNINSLNLDELEVLFDSTEFYNNKYLNQCDYVLFVNVNTNKTYKIKGFNENDFFSFIDECIKSGKNIQLTLKNKAKGKLDDYTIRKFLDSDIRVDGMQLRAIYEQFVIKKRQYDFCQPCH